MQFLLTLLVIACAVVLAMAMPNPSWELQPNGDFGYSMGGGSYLGTDGSYNVWGKK